MNASKFALVFALVIGLALPAGAGFFLLDEVTVRTITEDDVPGRVARFSLPGELVLTDADGSNRRIPTAELVLISAVASSPVANHDRTKLELLGGDRLFGRISAGDEDRVRLWSVPFGDIELPLDAIVAIEFPASDSPEHQGLVAGFKAAHADEDRVLLSNGDIAMGFITAVDAEVIKIENARGEQSIAHALVLAVRFSQPAPAPHEGIYAILNLRNNTRLTLTQMEWADGRFEAKSVHGPRVEASTQQVASVEIFGGRWEWLSSHEPIAVEHTPMLSMAWPWTKDTNVVGGPMRVAGRRFQHGVGAHSRSSLTYDLGGRYRELVTYLGLDDDSGPLGDVNVTIRVDGKVLFTRDHLKRGELLGPLRLDLSDARQLQLIVDFGDNGDLQDRFNWADAALVR